MLTITSICFVFTLHTMKEVKIGTVRLTLPGSKNETGVLLERRKAAVRGNNVPESSSLFDEITPNSNAKQRDRASEKMNYTSFWNSLDAMIGNGELYSNDFDVNIVTNALRNAKVVGADVFKERTSLKWILILEGGQTVVFKPTVVNNTELNSHCNVGCEHPEYEIAGFTVNRLLGYRNFPFTTGRVLNWRREVLPVATERLKKSMNITEDGDVCLRVKCFRMHGRAFKCLKNAMVPGAMIYFLRKEVHFRQEAMRHYHGFYPEAEYMKKPNPYMLNLPDDDSDCNTSRQMRRYRNSSDFGDILDITVISYITNNRDQKVSLIQTGSSYMHVMFDFGLAFCLKYNVKLAAPIYKCCSIRRKSFERLKELKDTLPSEFEEMTRGDPLYPILQPSQLQIMINRIKMLLALIEYCINLKGFDNVVGDFISLILHKY